jgi:hypothetical protein
MFFAGDEVYGDEVTSVLDHPGWDDQGCYFTEEYQPPDEAVTLEGCICGEHFDCPDGWHYGTDLPCSCTPDCVLTDDHGLGCDGPLNCTCDDTEEG